MRLLLHGELAHPQALLEAGGRCGSRLYGEPFVSERAGAGDA